MALKILNFIYMFGSVKCSFRAFLSRMEYQASIKN